MRDAGQGVAAARSLLLVGGGHAHIGVLKRLAMRPVPGLAVTLVSDTPWLDYSGMLPGRIAGHYRADETRIDLRRLARFAGADYLGARAVGLDADARRLRLAGRPDLGFDIASLDIGSAPADVSMAPDARVIPVKPVSQLMAGIAALERELAGRDRPLRVAVLGGGAGGVELALSLAHRLAGSRGSLQLQLVTRGDALLGGQAPAAARRLRRALATADIELITGAEITRIEADALVRADGRRLAADMVFCATGAQPPAWLAETGLATDARGFVAVDWTLASRSHPMIFAAGDIAALPARRPKSGVYAIREAPILADNLVRAARDRPGRAFRAQRSALALISLGTRSAIAVRGGMALGPAAILWRLKDWIDRRFITRFSALPTMDASARPRRPRPPVTSAETRAAPAMRCAGCGGKLGRDALVRVLRDLAAAGQAGIAAPGADDTAGMPDAAVLPPVPDGHEQLQSIDQITDPLADPWRFGRLAAQHALNDLYAAGATPVGALVNVGLPFADAALSAERLRQLLAGAAGALDEAGAVLLGGHTAEAETLTLGLAVTGTRALAAPPVAAAPGDALLLTRPLGSGLLFAADARHAAPGDAVEAVIETLMTSQRAAAAVLDAHGGRARTDVTGFGLAIHLSQLLAGTGYGARLALDRLPVFPGAAALAARGVRSSLHARNAASAARIRRFAAGAERDPRAALLDDPQTAGGLLAIVPARTAEACLAALWAAGYPQSALIGRLDAISPGTLVIESNDKPAAAVPSS